MSKTAQAKTLTGTAWQYACRRLAKCGRIYATAPLAEAAFHAGAEWMYDRLHEWMKRQIQEGNIEVKHIGLGELMQSFVDEIAPKDEQDD